MLRHRLTFGPLMIAAVLGLLWLDEWIDRQPWDVRIPALGLIRDTPPPGVVLFLVCVPVSFLAASELARILRDNGVLASRRIMCFAALAGLCVSCLIPSTVDAVTSVAIVSSAAVVSLLCSLLFYSRNKTVEGSVAAAGGTLLSFVYLGLMFGFLLAIRRNHPAWVLLWVVLVTKMCDTGAFFTGKTIGRHKLIRWLSPGKTWEGLAGGVLFAALISGLWALAFGQGMLPRPWNAAAAGAVFGLVGQAGDLIASLFKRDAGLKDSSSLLPGFGGMLDVLDSPLLVAPVAYWWLQAFPGGG